VLDKCAAHATANYQDALNLYQHVEMPDPAMDAQEVIDSVYDSELPSAFCSECEAITPADEADETGWRCRRCGTYHEEPHQHPTDAETDRVFDEERNR
jgi:tRNA(Ile2) C34 agmatinyltransferase TiaS